MSAAEDAAEATMIVRSMSRSSWIARVLRGAIARTARLMAGLGRRRRSEPLFRARPTSTRTDRGPIPNVRRIVVGTEFDEAKLFQRLQSPGSKLVDLRGVATISVGLFQRLADSWTAAHGTVPRLALVLDYECWVGFAKLAEARLAGLGQRGVDVAVFYAQQLEFGRLPIWFAAGRVSHVPGAVVAWLRNEWPGSPLWASVLSATAILVKDAAAVEIVPDLLLELAAIARMHGQSHGEDGRIEASKHLQAALYWVGDMPSAARCRVLRALASVSIARGDERGAMSYLETAISAATTIRNDTEEANALVDLGRIAARLGRFAEAERRLRRAIARLTHPRTHENEPDHEAHAYLRAMVHHQLALALEAQHRYDEAAEHAHSALELRWDPGSRLAEEDRALLERIQGRRDAARNQRSRSRTLARES